jgi:hypothetical protein
MAALGLMGVTVRVVGVNPVANLGKFPVADVCAPTSPIIKTAIAPTAARLNKWRILSSHTFNGLVGRISNPSG